MSNPTDPAEDDKEKEYTFMKKYLNCPVCLDMYTEDRIPRFLPCGHTFCSKCIPVFLAKSPICAICRAPVSGGKDQEFQINFQINSMIGVKDMPKIDTAEEMEAKWKDVYIATDNMIKVAVETGKYMEEWYQRLNTFMNTHKQKVNELRENGTRKEVLVVTEERIKQVTGLMYDEQQKIKEMCNFIRPVPTGDYFVSKNYLKRKLEPNPREMKEYYERMVEKYPGNDRDARMAFGKNVRKSMEEFQSQFQSQMDKFFPKEPVGRPAVDLSDSDRFAEFLARLRRPNHQDIWRQVDGLVAPTGLQQGRPIAQAVRRSPARSVVDVVNDVRNAARLMERSQNVVPPMPIPLNAVQPIEDPRIAFPRPFARNEPISVVLAREAQARNAVQPTAAAPVAEQPVVAPPLVLQPIVVPPNAVQQEQPPPDSDNDEDLLFDGSGLFEEVMVPLDEAPPPAAPRAAVVPPNDRVPVYDNFPRNAVAQLRELSPIGVSSEDSEGDDDGSDTDSEHLPQNFVRVLPLLGISSEESEGDDDEDDGSDSSDADGNDADEDDDDNDDATDDNDNDDDDEGPTDDDDDAILTDDDDILFLAEVNHVQPQQEQPIVMNNVNGSSNNSSASSDDEPDTLEIEEVRRQVALEAQSPEPVIEQRRVRFSLPRHLVPMSMEVGEAQPPVVERRPVRMNIPRQLVMDVGEAPPSRSNSFLEQVTLRRSPRLRGLVKHENDH